LIGASAIVGTGLSSTVIDLTQGLSGAGAQPLEQVLRANWSLWASVLPMLAEVLAYTLRRRLLAAGAVAVLVAAEVTIAAVYGAAGAVVAVLPLIVAMALTVLLVREPVHPHGDGLWWRLALLLAVPAGLASGGVFGAGQHLSALSSDQAYPVLLAIAGLLVAAAVYAWTLGRPIPRLALIVTVAVLLLGQLPAAVWGMFLAGDTGTPQHGRGLAGSAIRVLFVAFMLALTRRSRRTPDQAYAARTSS
jgi:hypothetical protein